MNANAFFQLYDHHFEENRKLWDLTAQLSDEEFRQNWEYSRSLRTRGGGYARLSWEAAR